MGSSSRAASGVGLATLLRAEGVRSGGGSSGGPGRGDPAGVEPVAGGSTQKQARHINGPNYRHGGYFDDAADAQKALDEFHDGTATVLGVHGTGNNPFVVVRSPNVRGVDHNPPVGLPPPADRHLLHQGQLEPERRPCDPRMDIVTTLPTPQNLEGTPLWENYVVAQLTQAALGLVPGNALALGVEVDEFDIAVAP